MRTSFHHQPEAQHPIFQLSTSWQADYPIFRVKNSGDDRGDAAADAAKQRLYSITSSASESSDGGTSRPSALAVLRLTSSSYLVGVCTGRSVGFSPLRMRST